MPEKRRKDFSPATKFCVVATDTAVDSRSTAEVTSDALTEPSPSVRSRPAKNRRAWFTYPWTVPGARPRSTNKKRSKDPNNNSSAEASGPGPWGPTTPRELSIPPFRGGIA